MLAAVFNSRSAFHAQWRRCETERVSDGIAGRWIGEWISQRSGHRGGLKCVFTPASAGVYQAYFYATFSRLFSVGYVTQLKAEQISGRARLTGEEDLGPLAGGIYRCEGEVSGNEFNCRYSCKYDNGIFRLKRVD